MIYWAVAWSCYNENYNVVGYKIVELYGAINGQAIPFVRCSIMRKPTICICENKDADQLIRAFVFTIQIVQFLYCLNPKFQASSHLL